MFALAYLALVVTAGAFVAWYAGLTRLGSERAGLFSGLIPISSLVCGVIIGATTLTPIHILGSILVGSGVVLGLHTDAKKTNTLPQ